MKASAKPLAAAIVLVSVVLLFCRTSATRILYGGLVGNVTDQSGGAVAGAKVTINQAATVTTREATTNEAGAHRWYHRFLRVKGGFIAVAVNPQDREQAFVIEHCDVLGNVVNRRMLQRRG